MASTRRGDILEFLRASIQALPSVEVAEVNSTRALHAVIPANIPYVNITTFAKYIPEESGTGDVEHWELNATINMITQADNAEDIRGDIKEAINADITQGGYAVNTIYDSDIDIIDLAIPAGAQGVAMEIMIRYITAGGKKI